MARKKLDWKTIDPLLGTMPDGKLAGMYKIDINRIVTRRYALGVSAFQTSKNWSAIDPRLGEVPDVELARIHKISPIAIKERRVALGIPGFVREQKWDWASIDPLLKMGGGSILDISRKFDVPESMLYYRCKKLGIIYPKLDPPCWAEIDPLLGTMSDIKLGKKFNTPTRSVNKRRNKLGIPPYRTRPVIDWTNIDPYLGTCPDKELAEEYDVSTTTIGNRRRLLGIPSFSGIIGRKSTINWEIIEPHLGTTTDKKLADKYNLSATTIWARRRKLGIKPYFQPVDWKKTEHLFYKIPDMDLAKMQGVSTPAVAAARKKLGISASRKDLSVIDPYLDTLSVAEIAEKFGLKKWSVYHRRQLVKRKKLNNST